MCLLFVGLIANAQITGFGKIKLGMSIGQIDEIKNSKKITDEMVYISKVWNNHSNTESYELVVDTTTLYSQLGSLDLRVRTFTVPSIKINENIEIELVELKFFNDTLYSIHCDYNREVVEALTIKYGEPKTDIKEEEHQFVYTYTGNTVTKTDRKIRSNWDTGNSDISCESLLWKYYSDKGEERFISYIELVNYKIGKDVKLTEDNFRDKIRKRIEEKKKKSVSDF
jgi:hypothetical protein